MRAALFYPTAKSYIGLCYMSHYTKADKTRLRNSRRGDAISGGVNSRFCGDGGFKNR